MNQSLLDSSNRHTRKRNSHEAIKNAFSLKNPKKSLPQVCIDLNQHHKKTKLALQQRNSKVDEPSINLQHFTDGRRTKAYKKKDQLVLNQMYNTEQVRTQNQNKNILNQYRDEIQLLKLENERLKEENQRYRKNEDYFLKRLNQIKLQRSQQTRQLKEYTTILEKKVQKYSTKIKQLFQQLINLKKSRITHQDQRHSAVSNEGNRQRTRAQLYSYRHNESKVEGSKWKRMTSPSDHDREKIHWMEQQMDNMLQFQKRGEEAYYKVEKGLYGTFHQHYQ